MLYFNCDYAEGAHPAILRRLSETNGEQAPGYGLDEHCGRARALIAEACACADAEVHFLMGGTQANATVIKALLREHEGVISADTGHINGHEAGAIEATGHKVLALPHSAGKLDAAAVRTFCAAHFADESCEHMVAPGMVYISHPTEYGTVYTLFELTALRAVCDEFRLPLFMDGARLGYGLATPGSDVDLPGIASLCDAFTIGGTKVGALFGEAVVFTSPGLVSHFFSLTKQHGALLAKGRVLGIQFECLFTDGLYLAGARHGIRQAMRIRDALGARGYRFAIDSPTNQQFVILENGALRELARSVAFTVWERPDATHTVIRLATSWATREEDVDALIALL